MEVCVKERSKVCNVIMPFSLIINIIVGAQIRQPSENELNNFGKSFDIRPALRIGQKKLYIVTQDEEYAYHKYFN